MTEREDALMEVQVQESLAQNQQLSQRVTAVETIITDLRSTVAELKNTINSFKKWIQVGVIAAVTGIGGGVGVPLLTKSNELSPEAKALIQTVIQAQSASGKVAQP